MTSKAVPAAGKTQDRRTMLAKNKNAQTMAIAAKIALAGSTAFTSV